MQCSIALERDRASGIKMKTNSYKNPYRKEANLDNIVDQLCTRLQDIKDQESVSRVGMPTCALDHSEAVRRYYAAFPALAKAESPRPYYLPPPAWCRQPPPAMQAERAIDKDWPARNKKAGKERRNSYHAPKKNRKRCTNYSRSLDAKQSLPEWFTSEGVWDMDAQDPVKEFIRALALDEGYGTAENEPRRRPVSPPAAPAPPPAAPAAPAVPDWLLRDDLQPRALTPMDEELYAKFEAKFDRSLEALWGARTPDDDYRELPIDFQELLSSPSDRLFAAGEGAGADGLRAQLAPLRLGAGPGVVGAEPAESFALYEGEELLDALSAVAGTLRSLTAINHSRERSGFAEVPPRRRPAPPPPRAPPAAPPPPPPEREDLLTSARTHFRPIRREADAARYRDGDSFDIRGDLEPVELRRGASGGLYYGSALFLEYRTRSIDYGRLELTPAQRTTLDEPPPRFRLRFAVRQRDAAVQTEREPAWGCDECGASAKKMRSSAMDSIWSAGACGACAAAGGGAGGGGGGAAPARARDELSREWEELLADISAAHAEYARADLLDEALRGAERKRRHSAAASPAPTAVAEPRRARPHCSHPHARFLHCCASALDRPLTR